MRFIDIKTGSPRTAPDSMQVWAYKKLGELNPSMETPGLTFDAKEHAYTLEGVPLVSVTQILHTFIPNPFLNDPVAAQRGTFIHRLCQQFIEIGNINWVAIKNQWPELIPYLSAFRDWYNQEQIKRESVLCETPLASGMMGFAGTVDIIIQGEKNGIFNLYLKPDGKFDFIPRDRERKYNWNLFNSMLNVYNFQRKEGII
jgi:hypothetical protein